MFAGQVNSREVPARDVPVPNDVSTELQKAIGAGFPPAWSPKTVKDWEALRDETAKSGAKTAAKLLTELGVTSQKAEMGGIPVYILTPKTIPAENKDRVILHIHGGGYCLNPGESALPEGILTAAFGGFKVISVDYRLAPEHPYPAPLDDSLAVYKALLKQYPAKNIGLIGTSAGGSLVLALALKAEANKLPVPGAIVAGTPSSDLSFTGDTRHTNAEIDNVLVRFPGWVQGACLAYAGSHDLKDPFLSPVYGNYKNFPPTMLGSGTRDLFLSDAARVHRKLRKAERPAELVVIEGISHAQYALLGSKAPETRYYYRQVSDFFNKYLAK